MDEVNLARHTPPIPSSFRIAKWASKVASSPAFDKASCKQGGVHDKLQVGGLS